MDGDLGEGRQTAERELDWCKVPASERMLGLIERVRDMLLTYEEHWKPRKRKRRDDDQHRFDRMVSAVICDLTHSALQDSAQWRRISLSKDKLWRRNVGPEFVTEALRPIVDYMAARGTQIVELSKGGASPFGRTQSTIRAGRTLRTLLGDRGITFADIGRDVTQTGDPIVVRSEKVKGEAQDLEVPRGEPAATYRSQMLTINKWLAQADIKCEPGRADDVDTGNRWLRRIFNNGSLQQGGRVFGGFWPSMDSERRLRHIYIDREPVVGLDYGQCVVRIAYGHLGLEPPDGDLYQLQRVDPLRRYRDGVKKVFNAMLFSNEPLKRKPQDSAKQLPKNYTIGELQDAIRGHHAPIASLFHTGFGMTSQFIESQILIRCLLTLVDRGVTALPVHDCLVVPRSSVGIAKQVMLESFQAIAGAQGAVDEKVFNRGPNLSLQDEDF
jgi:hypothetical protein